MKDDTIYPNGVQQIFWDVDLNDANSEQYYN